MAHRPAAMLAGEDSDADVALVPRRLLQARAQAAPEEAAAAAPAPGQAPEPEAECGGNDGGDEVSMLLLARRQLDCFAPEGMLRLELVLAALRRQQLGHSKRSLPS